MTGEDPNRASAATRSESRLGRWLIGGAFFLVVAVFIAALVLGGRNPRFDDRREPAPPAERR